VVVLSGHSHGVHEFRTASLDSPAGALGLHINNYSDQVDFGAPVFRDSDKRRWLDQNAPLFMTSGTTRSSVPKVRVIRVDGNGLTSFKMVWLPRIYDVAMSPASPAALKNNEWVSVAFNYATDAKFGVRAAASPGRTAARILRP